MTIVDALIKEAKLQEARARTPSTHPDERALAFTLSVAFERIANRVEYGLVDAEDEA